MRGTPEQFGSALTRLEVHTAARVARRSLALSRHVCSGGARRARHARAAAAARIARRCAPPCDGGGSGSGLADPLPLPWVQPNPLEWQGEQLQSEVRPQPGEP